MEIVLILVMIGFITLGSYMLREAFSNRIIAEKLSFDGFPKSLGEFTFLFISDIHRRTINEEIIHGVKDKAEIVIIGGDLTEKGVPFARVKNNLIQLKQIGPVYFVWGNNDYKVNTDRLLSLLRECGIIILNNETLSIRKKDKEFVIIGIDDLMNSREPIENILDGRKKDDFRMLISHNPDIIHVLEKEHNISLVLSGHTHGGQIRIFGFGPYSHGGIRNINGTTLFISNGYGTRHLPLRLGAKSETHLITIGYGDTKNI
ncbi:metallophosphoesterase [Lederbergia lenta]|uniref:Metallophosphoesterase n=1 Tax=Lederbergia lenta TaxID=1467 RepID=A0A2X4W1G8_LEDLE|nr:metallophosphoesterase [Lederbergia lenta]MEC2324984.1 metallophosphoesterase [Lederbergia lenta]SQI56519.1 metallophosphoesterase [Lederbergia lenta]